MARPIWIVLFVLCNLLILATPSLSLKYAHERLQESTLSGDKTWCFRSHYCIAHFTRTLNGKQALSVFWWLRKLEYAVIEPFSVADGRSDDISWKIVRQQGCSMQISPVTTYVAEPINIRFVFVRDNLLHAIVLVRITLKLNIKSIIANVAALVISFLSCTI